MAHRGPLSRKSPDSRNRPHLSDQAQDPDGERGGRAHGPDHPPDAPGFPIRELDPTHAAARSTALTCDQDARTRDPDTRATRPWILLADAPGVRPARTDPGGAARHRRAAEHPQPPGVKEAKTHDRSSVLATRHPTWRTRQLAARPSRRAARPSLGARRLAGRPPPRSRCARSRRR